MAESFAFFQELNFFAVFTFFVQGTHGSSHAEELPTLLVPTETVPVLPVGVNNQDHCSTEHCTQHSCARRSVNSGEVGLQEVHIAENNGGHGLHLVTDGNQAGVLFILFAKGVEQRDCTVERHHIV